MLLNCERNITTFDFKKEMAFKVKIVIISQIKVNVKEQFLTVLAEI